MTAGATVPQNLLTPTRRLPPIGKIPHSPASDLASAVSYLSKIYNPEICGVRYVSRQQCSLDGKTPLLSTPRRQSDTFKAQSAGPVFDTIRSDSFEREYAMCWLTALISQTDHLYEEHKDWESVVQTAAHLLAICAGPSAAGLRTRVFAFSVHHNEDGQLLSPVRVRITDLPLDNQDYTSVGAQTWGGACLLADMIVDSPRDLGLVGAPMLKRPLRILELGAGTGLVGIVIAKLLHASNIPSEVILTDFHQSVLDNLRRNIVLSTTGDSPCSVSGNFLDWSTFPTSEHLSPFRECFDQIYGADVIYELNHARWLKGCVELLLRKPSPETLHQEKVSHSSRPCFYLVLPLRSTHQAESHTVEEVFPFAPAVHTSTASPDAQSTPLYVLAITAKEMIICGDIWSDDSREVEYLHYTISWV